MSHDHHEAPAPPDRSTPTSRFRRRRLPFLVGIAAVGGLVLSPQVLPASGEPVVAFSSASALAVVAPQPRPGESWIQGVLTDQAGHTLNNVNVEAWSTDTAASVPVASNLTYAGTPLDNRHQSGVFRLAVPAGTPYLITFSTVGGREDGDQFRRQNYGGGRPIMTRPTAPSLWRMSGMAVVAAPGRIVNLGTIQLVRQGTVASTTTARLASTKVRVGQNGILSVRVTSRFVTNVTGKVQVRASGKTVNRWLAVYDHGRFTVRLPKLNRGTHLVQVMFKGTNTMAPSRSNPLRLIVMKRK